MMNENVKKLLNEQIWYLATYSDEPNNVPVGLKMISSDGKLLVAHLLCDTTVENIKANGKIAVSVCSPQAGEGYQIKGKAEYKTEGEYFDTVDAAAQAAFKGAMSARGVIVITPEKVIVTSPNADNKKVL